MKVYSVTDGDFRYNVPLGELFNDKDETGTRIYARSNGWPKVGILVGGLETVDFDAEEGTGLKVDALNTCSAVFYLYMDPASNPRKISAALAFHSPSGSRGIRSGPRKNGDLEGPLAEAKHLGQTVKPENVLVCIAAGPKTMINHIAKKGKELNDGAAEELGALLLLLDAEKIPSKNRFVYSSSGGQFGLSAEGFLGEPIGVPQPTTATPPVGKVKAKKKKRCYVSTATCTALGLPDDCEELTLLRWYRDHVLSRTPGGRRDIEAYYSIAPDIVVAIDARDDAAAIYRDLFHRSLAPAIAAIRAGQLDDAYTQYREMVDQLQTRFGSR